MSLVTLKRDWFDPSGKLWLARDGKQEIPYEKEDLPKDAKVQEDVEDKAVKKKSTEKSETL